MTTPQKFTQYQARGGETSSHISQTRLSQVTPSILRLIKTIADGARAFDAVQLAEFASFVSYQKDATSALLEIEKPIDFHELLKYFTSPTSNALKPPEVYDLHYPISNYFISSSHNTYLSGNQLYGASSVETYRNALLRGCRCVEIDVWDGEKKDSVHSDVVEEKHRFKSHVPSILATHLLSQRSKIASADSDEAQPTSTVQLPSPWITNTTATRIEPRVLHGHTLTKEVSFRDVCIAIREAAFTISDLPVIVSLEVHAGAEQQEIMVEIMEKTWQGLLIVASKDECAELPNLAELRGKILVKVKHGEPTTPKGTALQMTSTNASQSDSDEHEAEKHATIPRPKKSAMIRALCAMGVYTQGYHFKSLASPEALSATHVFSLSEKKLIEVYRSSGPTLFSHNKNFLMRVYPSGRRFSSSNLDPLVFWALGCQVVALNWQRWDAGMMLNEGMFAGSGGWVLKPVAYRGDGQKGIELGFESKANPIPRKLLNLGIELFAAQNLPVPMGDSRPESLRPYVKCELHITQSEEKSGEPIEKGGKSKGGQYKRRTKTGKSIDPDFGGETMIFDKIPQVIDELSFLRFKIQNDGIGKDALVAWACIRLDRLNVGYRFVHLLDANGLETNGVLFVNIQKQLV